MFSVNRPQNPIKKVRIGTIFRGTSKTVFITYDQLLHHRLHLGIKGMQIGTDLF